MQTHQEHQQTYATQHHKDICYIYIWSWIARLYPHSIQRLAYFDTFRNSPTSRRPPVGRVARAC